MRITICFGTTIALVYSVQLFCKMSRGTIIDNMSVLSLDDVNVQLKDEGQEQYMFKIKSYIPNKYRFKCLYCAAASGTIVLGILVAVTVICTKNSSSTIASSQISSKFGGKLVILTNDTKLLTLDPRTNDLSLITEGPKNSVTAFDVHNDGRIYWSEIATSRLVALAPSVDNYSSSILLDDGRLKAKGLALDCVAENLYVVDETAGVLIVLNVRLGHYVLLMSDLTQPRDVVLDPQVGFMFVLQSTNSIVRANMDGTGLTSLVTNIGITALTLDQYRKRLYWISDFVNIESSDYGGFHRRSFFTDTVTIATLTILDERVYWLWPSHGHVTNLLSCEIARNGSCEDYKVHDIDDIANAESIKSYPTIFDEESNNNPCEIKNGGCQQLCLISAKNRRSCSCCVGWQLNTDRRSCREASEFVVYPYDHAIRACSLDGSKDLMWPTRYEVASLRAKSEIDFDYDSRNDNFYFSDDTRIYMMKLGTAGNQTEILHSNASDVIIEDVAYDWLTGNLYFVERSINTSNDRHSIILVNPRLGEDYRKTIVTVKHRSPFNLERCPYSLVLHPARGYVFYACDLDGPPIIRQVSMNGTDVFRYNHPFLPMSYRHILSVDYLNDSLYWISFSVDMTFIERAKINQTFSSSLTVDEVRRADAIDVLRQWLFVSNSTSIWRVDKSTGKDSVKIAPRIDRGNSKRIDGMKIVSEVLQSLGTDNNPCEVDNGGCEQFCFATGDKATCDCRDGQLAGSDGQCT